MLNSGTDVNGRLVELARRASVLLRHLPVSLSDRIYLEGLAGDNGSPSESGAAGRSLALEGVYRFAHEPPPSREAVEANRVRLVALRGIFERLTAALAGLSETLERKLHPPEVKDRVKVDVKARRVSIDGSSYGLNTREQAIVLDQLVKANGGPLSGPEIARGAGLDEAFPVSRVWNQIKNKRSGLERFMPSPHETGNRFCLRLPRLP
jgi:hypothetical protein